MRSTPLVRALASHVDRTVKIEWGDGLGILFIVNSPLHEDEDNGLYSSCLGKVQDVLSKPGAIGPKAGDWIEVTEANPPVRVMLPDGEVVWSGEPKES